MTIEEGSTIKRMCYDLRHYLVITVGALELLQDAETPSADKQRMMEQTTRQARAALETAEKLFKTVCVLDPVPTQW